MEKTVIVTGGCGFIGHHLVEHLLKETNWNIIIFDKLTYASKGYDRIRDLVNNDRVNIFTIDLSKPISDGIVYELGNKIDYIIHMAAETHVDRSIENPVDVVKNNIMSTVYLLEYCRKIDKLDKFIYFSTDEVYGPACGNKMFGEEERHNSANPYAASKSGSEQICLSYMNTWGIPVIIINVMNVFGERQHSEKFIPKVIKKLCNGEKIQIYTDKDGNEGSRFYIHARNVASAVLFIIKKGIVGENYNITGEKEVSNIDMAKFIANVMDSELNYEYVNNERLGNDIRYGLRCSKLKELGWEISCSFDDSLKKCILWTLKNKKWLR